MHNIYMDIFVCVGWTGPADPVIIFCLYNVDKKVNPVCAVIGLCVFHTWLCPPKSGGQCPEWPQPTLPSQRHGNYSFALY